MFDFNKRKRKIDNDTSATTYLHTVSQNENIEINFGKCHKKIKRKKNTWCTQCEEKVSYKKERKTSSNE